MTTEDETVGAKPLNHIGIPLASADAYMMVGETTVPPLPESVSAARSFLRTLLKEKICDDVLDNAQLLISEIVTNATLHAHTQIAIAVYTDDDQVHVQVRDYNEQLPTSSIKDDVQERSMTGRGLDLVASLATEYGVTELGPEGKIVWFTCSKEATENTNWDHLESWDLEELVDTEEETQEVEVVIIEMTSADFLQALQDQEDLLREIALWLVSNVGNVENMVLIENARRTIKDNFALHESFIILQLPCTYVEDFKALHDVLTWAQTLVDNGELLYAGSLEKILELCSQLLCHIANK